MREPLVKKRGNIKVVQTGMPEGFMGFTEYQVSVYEAFERALVLRRQQAIARDVKELVEKPINGEDLDIRSTQAGGT